MPNETSDLGPLLETMSDLARGVAETPGVETTLAGVTAACLELVPGTSDAAILIVNGPENYGSMAPTSERARNLDGLQHKYHQGPCWDAATSDLAVRSDDLEKETRWPAFAPAAVALGAHSMLSFRLFTHDDRMAALNLFSDTAGAFTDESDTVGGMLATHAAIALISNDRHLQFRSALASRDIIGQAKGMIMERFDVDAVRAFELLSRLSSDSNTRLADVAEQIVSKGSARRSS
ncbi:GAF and ANTAR domain-containing protein [Jongsikchunia kroppenstedtii]|uniref:GAF and ANTAR domain-containing protein n=1 Tax=Jongsikchunia kroppenstedtii TaxID=1121721 RepID=UPI001FDFADE7|nr:GAF and ANTAR domain-containing protein [Jongsikchunia kroppenstedtii]